MPSCGEAGGSWPQCAQTYNQDAHCGLGWDTRKDAGFAAGSVQVAQLVAAFQEANPDAGMIDGKLGPTTLAVAVRLAKSDVAAQVSGWGSNMWESLLLPGLPYDEAVVKPACGGGGGGGGGNGNGNGDDGHDFTPRPQPVKAGGGMGIMLLAVAAFLLMSGKK
jgi:hypothetical protein